MTDIPHLPCFLSLVFFDRCLADVVGWRCCCTAIGGGEENDLPTMLELQPQLNLMKFREIKAEWEREGQESEWWS